MVKNLLASLEKSLVPLNDFLRNEYLTGVIALFVVLYASNVSPRLPDVVMDLFNNPVFRVFVLFLVAYVANKNPAVALLVSVGFVVTLNVINRQEAEEGFLDVIDTFNSPSNGNVKEHFASNACSSLKKEHPESPWGACQNAFSNKDSSDANVELLSTCCSCAGSPKSEGGQGLTKNCNPSQEGCSDFKAYCSPAGEESGEEYVFKNKKE